MSAPAWHDVPTEPGLWIFAVTGQFWQLSTVVMPDWFSPSHERCYGPIPSDPQEAK